MTDLLLPSRKQRANWRVFLMVLSICAVVVGGLTLMSTQALAAEGERPAIDGVSTTNIGETDATIEAQINPEGLETSYEIWVLCQDATLEPGHTCEPMPGAPRTKGHIEAGFGDRAVIGELTDLQPEHYYWYGVLATNSAGKTESLYHLLRTTMSNQCSSGCSIPIPPYKSELSPGMYEAASRYAEEALAREAERQRAIREQAEREAMVSGGAPTGSQPLTATSTVSLVSTHITIENGAVSLVKLECLGYAICQGRLTLSAKVSSKAGSKRKPVSTVRLGSDRFSISGYETKTVKISLDAIGRALLNINHGRLSASLTILDVASRVDSSQTMPVRLTQQMSHRKINKSTA